MSGQRDLLPLPIPDSSGRLKSGLSHSVRQRMREQMHVQNWFQLGVQCLNELCFAPAQPPPCVDRVSRAQHHCLQQLRDAYAECPKPPSGLSAAEAHGALCGKFSCYPDEQGSPVAFERSLVALPSAGSPVNIA
eukprot:841379-Amphidinium_carterae.3